MWLWNRLAIVIVVFCGTSGIACAQATRPAGVQRILIISVDGLRPDVLLRADAPNIRGLMNRGSFTMWAHTTDVAITLPSHTSMLTGVKPEKHGINFNSEQADKTYPRVPTIFKLAKQKGLTTAMASGKAKFDVFDEPGALDTRWIFEKNAKEDGQTGQEAAKIIREEKPNVMLLHLAAVDSCGHAEGWGSPAQIAAVHGADAAVGVALAALKQAGLTDSTVIILSADHGGSNKNHGKDDERSHYIPWIAAGPGIRKNLDLTSFRELNIETMDTFATACFFMGIPLPADIDGKPIEQVLESYEMLKDTPPQPDPKPAVTNKPPAGAGNR